MMNRQSIMIVLEDGREYATDISNFDSMDCYLYERVFYEAIRHFKITTHRSKPQSMKWTAYNLSIKSGTIVRTLAKSGSGSVPHEPMTRKEYETEYHEIVKHIHPSFQKFVMNMINHDDDFETRIEKTKDLVENLNEAIKAFSEKTS